MFTKPAGFQPLKPSCDLSLLRSTGLANVWHLSTSGGAVGLPSGRRFFQLGVLCCLRLLRLAFSVKAPAAHWGSLPTLALPRSLAPPGCICGGDGGASAFLSGEGPVLPLSVSFHPSSADDPEPSDDGILLAREKDLTSLSELEQFQVIF